MTCAPADFAVAHVQAYVNGDYERGTLKAPFDFSTLPDECTPISKPRHIGTGNLPYGSLLVIRMVRAAQASPDSVGFG